MISHLSVSHTWSMYLIEIRYKIKNLMIFINWLSIKSKGIY